MSKYYFPEDKEECDSWLRALPNSNLTYDKVQEKMANGTRSKCVCALHWPPGVQTKLRGNRPFPAVPPSIFTYDIPKSVFYTPPKPPRPTTLSSSEARNRGVDQLEEHNKQFSFSATAPSDFLPRFTSILRKLGKIAVADNEKDIVLLSHGREGPIFDYTVIFTLVKNTSGSTTDVKFELFHKLTMVLTGNSFFGDHPPFLLPVSTVVLTGKTTFWGPPTLFCFLLPVSTVVLSGESLFGDHPPYLLPVSTMVLTGKNFLGDHPPFLLPVSTVVLTGNKIKRVPPRTNW